MYTNKDYYILENIRGTARNSDLGALSVSTPTLNVHTHKKKTNFLLLHFTFQNSLTVLGPYIKKTETYEVTVVML